MAKTDKRKITRRAVLGSAVAGSLAGTAAVVQALSGGYETALAPSPAPAGHPGTARTLSTGTVTGSYSGIAHITTISRVNGGPPTITCSTRAMGPTTVPCVRVPLGTAKR